MTIYHHVPNKEAIIDGMVDLVFSEIEQPDPELDWKTAIRRRCASARVVLARHRWAVPYMESRTSPGPATLSHHDAVLGCFAREMSIEMTAHAYATLDAYVYGFAAPRGQPASHRRRRNGCARQRHHRTVHFGGVSAPRRVHDAARDAARLRLSCRNSTSAST